MFSNLSLLLLNFLLTSFLTGLIWFVQVVHYPIFSRVSPESFSAFHAAHMHLTGRVVILPMLAELGLAFVLAFRLGGWMSWTCLVLVLVAWFSTFLLSVPAHSQLGNGFDLPTIQRLVSTNWIRCWAWTIRAALLFFMLLHFFEQHLKG